MSTSYNLRSLQRKKGISVRNCHLQNHLGDRSPEAFNPKVCLERLKLLECHEYEDSKFYVKNGKVLIKHNKPSSSNKKLLLKTLCIVILIITSLVYWKDHWQSNSANIVKNFSEIYPVIQKYCSAAFKFHRCPFNYSQTKPKNEKKESSSFIIIPKESNVIPKESLEIRQIVTEYFAEVKKRNKFQNTIKTSGSFIEEQCKSNMKDGFSAVKKFYNTTLFDEGNLTDYALESQGAKVVTVYDTELYGTLTVKVFNFNLWTGFSHFLLNHLKGCNAKGPNSVLNPWKKPGDCWAFKGSRGKIQIELSEEIIITAVSVDHIPKDITPDGYVESAPREFTVFGIKGLGKTANKTYLGGYEYETTGPSTQTFLVQSRVEIPFRRVEVIIESNHGSEKYTCVYKIRVHGHK